MLIVLLALIQAPQSIQLTPIYQKPFNDSLTLVLSAGENDLEQKAHLSQFSIDLVGRRGSKIGAGFVRDQGWLSYRVLRADDSSVVVGRSGTYTAEPTVKLFLHPEKKYSIKRIDYAPDVGLLAVDDQEAAKVLELPPAVLKQLEQKQLDNNAGDDSLYLPRELRDHPMPQSSQAELRRARPPNKDGWDPEGMTIEEKPGPSQVVGTRIWFGKRFYDGEGISGVGGIGYFDTSNSKYTLLSVPMVAEWSTSAILVEGQAVWVGLVGHPEGESYAGGLVRYDLKSGTSRKFPTEEVISRMVRWNDRLYVATLNGAYQLRGDTLIRYRVEPNINNRFIIISEVVDQTNAER
jgi:hypothetical protein